MSETTSVEEPIAEDPFKEMLVEASDPKSIQDYDGCFVGASETD